MILTSLKHSKKQKFWPKNYLNLITNPTNYDHKKNISLLEFKSIKLTKYYNLQLLNKNNSKDSFIKKFYHRQIQIQILGQDCEVSLEKTLENLQKIRPKILDYPFFLVQNLITALQTDLTKTNPRIQILKAVISIFGT